MRLALPALILFMLAACRIVVDDTSVVLDADEDGLTADVDCDDDDPTVGLPQTWYADSDDDTYGDAATTTEACDAPDGYVADATDCDDDDPAVHPGAAETWYDGVDQACDGGDDFDQDGDGVVSDAHGGTDCDDTDATASVLATWYVDCDGDGAFASATVDACGEPATACDGDPPSDATTTAPGAFDCDDDDASSEVSQDWYVDCDGDGAFAATPVASCGAPGPVCPGATAPVATSFDAPQTPDCLDDPTAGGADATPGHVLTGADVADGLDNDCMGGEECFPDGDGDGFGTGDEGSVDDDGDGACDDAGESARSDDCDDGEDGAVTFPGAAPEDDATACMRDADGDDWGDADVPVWITAGTDCEDDPSAGGADAFPGRALGADDVEDGLDNDCEGGEECFFDEDEDGFGVNVLIDDDGDGTCDLAGESTTADDCEDDPSAGGADAWPGRALVGADVADGLDNDCEHGEECFFDEDGDGYGVSTIVDDDGDGTCDDTGEAAEAGDCEDDPNNDGGFAWPGRTVFDVDVADGLDNDCTNGEECWLDADGDGFGVDTMVDDDGDGVCDDAGESIRDDDCADTPGTGANAWPGRPLQAGDVNDGLNNDCDAFFECYLDGDDDGVGTDQGTLVDTATAANCSDANHSTTATDCDDSDPSATAVQTWWIDCDGDGVHGLDTQDACGSDGLCDAGADPVNATPNAPQGFDCFDDDAGDPWCTDCQEIYERDATLADGLYWIDGDGSADVDGEGGAGDPFQVQCDFVTEGTKYDGGWIVLAFDDGTDGTAGDQRLFVAESGRGNPWYKCADVAIDRVLHDTFMGDDQVVPDGSTQVVTFNWTSPGGALIYDWEEEIEALTGLGLELWVDDGISGIPTNHLLAVVSDDDNGDWETDLTGGGHEIYLCPPTGTCDQTTGTLLTMGENGECGGASPVDGACDGSGNDWPICGTESSYWYYHTDDNEQFVAGQAGSPAPVINGSGLAGPNVLPARAWLLVATGGGVLLTWEYAEVRVR